MKVKLESFLQEVSEKTTENNQYPVLTSSKAGLYLQSDYFNKQVASKDNTGYKIIKRGQFTYRAMSDTGEFFPNMLDCADIGIVSPAYPVFEIAKPIIIPDFLKYYFKSNEFQQSIASFAQGSTRTSIKYGKLKTVLMELPDLKEQQKYIEILDTAQKIINDRKRELEKLDELIKARFVEMFGEPQDNPFGWDKMPLSNVILNANNGMARRGNDENGNIVMRLVELQDGYIDYSNPNRIVLKGNEKTRYLLRDKDFLFARVNGNPDNVGRCAVFEDIGEDVYHNDHIIRVHFNELLLDGTFASVLLNSDYGKRQLKGQIKTSAGQYTVSQDGIGAIVTILPPISLQKEFANFVNQVDKSKIVAQQMLDETQKLFDSLMQEYFG